MRKKKPSKVSKTEEPGTNLLGLVVGLLVVLALFAVVYSLVYSKNRFSSFLAEVTPVPTVYKLINKTRSASLRTSLTNLAKTDLAQKIGVRQETIKVASVLEKNWPDTSLGCSQPGMFYSQVITPGYLITLEVRSKKYEYHTDLEKAITCTD